MAENLSFPKDLNCFIAAEKEGFENALTQDNNATVLINGTVKIKITEVEEV